MRSAAIQSAGFTARQARFLVLVLEHSGVCLPRQYRRFARIAHGWHPHDLFDTLVRVDSQRSTGRRQRMPDAFSTSPTSRRTARWVSRITGTAGR